MRNNIFPTNLFNNKASIALKGVDMCHLILVKFKIKNFEVLFKSVVVYGLRNNHNSTLNLKNVKKEIINSSSILQNFDRTYN